MDVCLQVNAGYWGPALNHPVAALEGVARLLQKVDHHLLGQEGLPVGIDAGAQRQIGALPDPLLQLLNAAQGRGQGAR